MKRCPTCSRLEFVGAELTGKHGAWLEAHPESKRLILTWLELAPSGRVRTSARALWKELMKDGFEIHDFPYFTNWMTRHFGDRYRAAIAGARQARLTSG